MYNFKRMRPALIIIFSKTFKFWGKLKKTETKNVDFVPDLQKMHTKSTK